MSPRNARLALLALALAFALTAAGCGDSGTDESTEEFRPQETIIVYSPTSLDAAIRNYTAGSKLDTQISYAGSDQHATTIRSGENLPDLYLADTTALTDALFDEGLTEEPVAIATDELVVAVPADSKIDSLDDLTADGVRVAVGRETSPVGTYTEAALSGLPPAESKAIAANVTSLESNNNGIVLALTDGEADAGLVYSSDVEATNGKLKAIELPEDLRQTVVFAGAVVNDAENPAGGQHILDDLVDGPGAEQLQKAGFGPPPG